jgi:hypothetical protein
MVSSVLTGSWQFGHHDRAPDDDFPDLSGLARSPSPIDDLHFWVEKMKQGQDDEHDVIGMEFKKISAFKQLKIFCGGRAPLPWPARWYPKYT